MALVRLQARDAHDAERFTTRGALHPGSEARRIDAATNDDELSPRSLAVLAHEVLAVEGRDDRNERRGRELLLEHAPVDEDVVRVRGEAERNAGQAPDEVRGQRRVCRPMGMDVLDTLFFGLAREACRLGDDDPRAQQEPG